MKVNREEIKDRLVFVSIVTGGFPGKLARKVVRIPSFARKQGLISIEEQDKLEEGIEYCDFNMSDYGYHDDLPLKTPQYYKQEVQK